jgi:hypothetical protein
MHRNIIYLGILLLLLALCWWVYQERTSSTLDLEDSTFSIPDTSIVDQIFMADKTGGRVLLEKTGPGQWRVNDQFTARPDAMSALLDALLRMQVKSPVPRPAVDNIRKQLASIGRKVEVYSKGKKISVLYIGYSTIDSRGTYAIREGADLPYILHVPGTEGYLTPRFFIDEEEWRERILLRIHPDSIRSIEAQFPDTPAHSYRAELLGPRRFALYDGNGRPVATLSNENLTALFAGTRQIPVEGYDNHGVMRDSIVEMAPLRHSLNITLRNGKTHQLNFYPKSQLNQLDVVLLGVMPDLDRDYFYYKEGNDFGFIQKRSVPWMYFTLSDLMQTNGRSTPSRD